jgi:hypothetical protein
VSPILTLLAVQAAPVAPPPAQSPEVAREIVVIAQKLKGWKGGVTKEGGRMVCRTKTSSGEKAVDAIRCGAMLSCMKPLEPRIDALMGSDRSRREKRDGFAAILKGIGPCLEDYEAAAVARLAEARVAG